MKPLIRKTWYTLTEAADYLTRSTGGGPVTVSDVLQLAMEGAITLSVQVAETQGLIWPVGDVYPFQHLTQNEKEAMPKALKDDGATGALPPALYFGEKVYGTVEHRYEPLAAGLWDFYLNEPAKELITRIWGYSKKEDAPNMERFRLPKGEAAWTKAFITLVDDTRLTVYRIPARHIFNGNYLAVKQSELSKLLVEPGNTISSAPQQPNTSPTASTQTDLNRQHYPPQLEALPDDFRALYDALGAGELPDLDLLIVAWRTFWKDRRPNDGKKYPINADVADWIKNRMDNPEQGNSKAKAIASIIRPTWAPIGRQPNRNQ